MKSKKLVCFGLSAVMLGSVASFAGCQIANTQKPNDDVPVVENPDAEVELTVGVLQDSSERNLMQAWINKYQELHKNVSIKITKRYGAMSALDGYQSANGLPDICWTAGDQHAPYSDPSNKGYFQNLGDAEKFEGSAEFFAGFYDELIETTHFNGEDEGIWFVPRDYNRLVVYYNNTIFKAMGIEAPKDGWTWNEFLETCTKLMTETNGVKCKKAIEWRNWAPLHYTMIRNFGAEYVDAERNFLFDSAEGKACYEWYQSWLDTNAIIGDTNSSFAAYGSTSASSPAAAMRVDTYAGLNNFAAKAKANDWELNVVSFPNYEQKDGSAGYTGAGCSGYAITKACNDADKLEWAWKFLKWCMSIEGYNAVADQGVVCPALKIMENAGEWLNYEVGGTVINYEAYVNKATVDLDVNFQGVLQSTQLQEALVQSAQKLWNDAPTTSWNSGISEFRSYFEGKKLEFK